MGRSGFVLGKVFRAINSCVILRDATMVVAFQNKTKDVLQVQTVSNFVSISQVYSSENVERIDLTSGNYCVSYLAFQNQWKVSYILQAVTMVVAYQWITIHIHT